MLPQLARRAMVASVHEGQAIFATWDTWSIGYDNSLLVFASPAHIHRLQGVPEDVLNNRSHIRYISVHQYYIIAFYLHLLAPKYSRACTEACQEGRIRRAPTLLLGFVNVFHDNQQSDRAKKESMTSTHHRVGDTPVFSFSNCFKSPFSLFSLSLLTALLMLPS